MAGLESSRLFFVDLHKPPRAGVVTLRIEHAKQVSMSAGTPGAILPSTVVSTKRGSNQLERVVQYCCVATRRVRVYLLRNLHLKSLSVNFRSTEASSRRSCLLRTHSAVPGANRRGSILLLALIYSVAICYPLMPIMLAPSPSRHWWQRCRTHQLPRCCRPQLSPLPRLGCFPLPRQTVGPWCLHPRLTGSRPL